MEFSKYLSKLRKEKGLTQAELAEKMNVSDKTISKWETGKGFPETTLLVPLADIFGISVDDLLRGEQSIHFEEKNEKVENTTVVESFDKDNEDKREEKSYKNFKSNALTKREAIIVAVAVPIMLVGICIMTILATIGLNYGYYLPVLFVTLAVSVGMLSSMGMKKGVSALGGESSNEVSKYIVFISLGVALLIFSPTFIVCMYPFGVHVAIYMSLFTVVLTVALGFLILGGINYGNFMAQLALHQISNANNFRTDGTAEHENIDNYLERKTKRESISGAICGCLMIACTIAFLIAGLGFGIWHPTWVVFPVGGLLCGVVGIISDLKK